MLSTYSYHVTTHWTMHKRGIVEAESIPRTINFAAPPEFGGEPGLWTPEHLLLASVSTCFVSTFRAVAEASKLAFFGAEVEVDGKIEKLEGGFRFTKIVLKPRVTIHEEKDRERTGRLLEKSERACLVSRSLNCTIVLEPTILVEAPVGV
ncbi:MAG TPA: OsmC family protein [Terriglobales bacterium]|nr:OsmC family protein [Terriglobales bacterium]